MWDAGRECRNPGGEFQFALGAVILLMLNLYLGVRVLVQYLGSKQLRQEILSQQDWGVTLAVLSIAAVVAIQTLSPASGESETDDALLFTGDGADLNLDF